MPLFPEWEIPHSIEHHTHDLVGMITELIEQANVNYLKYMAAAACRDGDQAWMRVHESFELEKDIGTLTRLYEMAFQSRFRRMLTH